jgi:hypothetical protein
VIPSDGCLKNNKLVVSMVTNRERKREEYRERERKRSNSNKKIT